MSGLTIVSSSWLRRLEIGELCSVFGEKREEREGRVVRCVCVKAERELFWAIRERERYVERWEEKEWTNYDRRVPGRCLRV